MRKSSRALRWAIGAVVVFVGGAALALQVAKSSARADWDLVLKTVDTPDTALHRFADQSGLAFIATKRELEGGPGQIWELVRQVEGICILRWNDTASGEDMHFGYLLQDRKWLSHGVRAQIFVGDDMSAQLGPIEDVQQYLSDIGVRHTVVQLDKAQASRAPFLD